MEYAPKDEKEPLPSDPVSRKYGEAEVDIALPQFDLHDEMYREDADSAIRELESYLERLHATGTRRNEIFVRIIHGRGHGKFRKRVSDLLETMRKSRNSYILDWRESTRVDEIGGVTYVRLAPNSSNQ